MRTKTLLLTAALSVAGLATSMAQPVYSVNAVGYVNVTLPAGTFNLIANPLNGTNNLISTVLPSLPDANIGTQISVWDPVKQNFDGCQPIYSGAGGWFDCTGANTNVLAPGVAFFMQVIGPTLNLTFVGEVPQGTLVNPLSNAPGQPLSFISSIVPQRGRVDQDLGLPASVGDSVATFSPQKGTYNADVIKLDATMWVDGDGVVGEGPIIEVGQGFVFNNVTGTAPPAWTRSFSVN